MRMNSEPGRAVVSRECWASFRVSVHLLHPQYWRLFLLFGFSHALIQNSHLNRYACETNMYIIWVQHCRQKIMWSGFRWILSIEVSIWLLRLYFCGFNTNTSVHRHGLSWTKGEKQIIFSCHILQDYHTFERFYFIWHVYPIGQYFVCTTDEERCPRLAPDVSDQRPAFHRFFQNKIRVSSTVERKHSSQHGKWDTTKIWYYKIKICLIKLNQIASTVYLKYLRT